MGKYLEQLNTLKTWKTKTDSFTITKTQNQISSITYKIKHDWLFGNRTHS